MPKKVQILVGGTKKATVDPMDKKTADKVDNPDEF